MFLPSNTTFWKNNLLEKGWAKIQPFEKRLDQNQPRWRTKINPDGGPKLQPFLKLMFIPPSGLILVQPFSKRLFLKNCIY